MSRIFSAVKEESLRMAIERAYSEMQSQIVTKDFHNIDKNTLNEIFQETSKFIKQHIEQDPKTKGNFSEKNSKNIEKSSLLSR